MLSFYLGYCTCKHFHVTTSMGGTDSSSFPTVLLVFFFLFFLAKGSSWCNHFLTMAQLLQSASVHSAIITVTHLACPETTPWEQVLQCGFCFFFKKPILKLYTFYTHYLQLQLVHLQPQMCVTVITDKMNM